MARPDDDLVLGEYLDPDERDIEAPTADAAEQAASVEPDRVDSDVPAWHDEPSRSLEVGEWDAFEQSLVVDFDDDYDR